MSVAGGEIGGMRSMTLREQEKVSRSVFSSARVSSPSSSFLPSFPLSSSLPFLRSTHLLQALHDKDQEIIGLKFSLTFYQDRLKSQSTESQEAMTKEIGDLRLAYLRLRAESKKNKKYALESQQAIEALKKEIAMLRKGGGAGGRGGGEGGGGKELELTERVREERERRKQVEERVEKAERELKELKEKRRETGVEEVSLFESFVSFPHSRVRNSVSLRGPDTHPPFLL